MSRSRPKLIFNQFIAAPPAQVFRAFTNASAMCEWLCDMATLEPHPGGRIYIKWSGAYYTTGQFLQVEPDRLLTFTWQGRAEPRATQVTVNIRPVKKGTRLRLGHRGLGRAAAWDQIAAEYEKGWLSSLANLVHVLEHGPDLRVVRRPMLGVNLSDFNAEIASRLGIPVSQGVRLDNVVEGLGAHAAGLQKDDLIVGLDGDPITDYASLSGVVARHQAGSSVELVFYRGAEKRTTHMVFSPRPVPEVPPTPALLAAEFEQRCIATRDRLDQFLAGVSEDQASFKPAPGEWSIKEVLAHLIQGERVWQHLLSDMIGGYESHYDDWGGNLQAWIEATVVAYPALDDLVGELKRLRIETRTLLERLPADFTARKSTYWRLGTQVLQLPYHDDIHLEQMQAALEAARKA